MMIEIVVPGVPAPQGSKTRTRWGVREDNPATKPWRNAVAGYALEAMSGQQPIAGPVRVEAVFTFPRPKGHYGSGRNAGQLKQSAPVHCDKAPDLDKLLRAIGDALTGVVLVDDSRIVEVAARKTYGTPGARILITPIRLFQAQIAA